MKEAKTRQTMNQAALSDFDLCESVREGLFFKTLSSRHNRRTRVIDVDSPDHANDFGERVDVFHESNLRARF